MSDSRVAPVPQPDNHTPTAGSARDVPILVELPPGIDASMEGALRSAVTSAVAGSGYTVHVTNPRVAVPSVAANPAPPANPRLSVVLPVYNTPYPASLKNVDYKFGLGDAEFMAMVAPSSSASKVTSAPSRV